jgi:hypothetical protein
VGVELTVTGQAELEATAARLAREARRFQRRISGATKDAVQNTYRPVLIGMVPQFMPGGYAPELARDLRTAVTVGLGSGRVSVRVSAPTGGKFGREVRQLEAGSLRHPLFGNRGFWYRQRVRRGFASVPLRATRPHIVGRINAELRDIARDVERG